MEQGTAEWLALRAKCVVTCSVYGDALGVGYTSQRKLWGRKLANEQVEATEIMLEGQKREPHVRSIFLYMFPQFDVKLPAFATLPEDIRFGGSPDGILVNCVSGEPVALLEVKTRPYRRDTRETIPVMHLIQMCGLLSIYKLQRAYYICSTYEESMQVAIVEFDDKVWPELYRRLQMFALWVETKTQPPRMHAQDKENLIAFIRRYTRITEPENTRLPPGSWQITQSKQDLVEYLLGFAIRVGVKLVECLRCCFLEWEHPA
jgi:hypothetical protein